MDGEHSPSGVITLPAREPSVPGSFTNLASKWLLGSLSNSSPRLADGRWFPSSFLVLFFSDREPHSMSGTIPRHCSCTEGPCFTEPEEDAK